MYSSKKYTFYEFFAGGGMARAGLGSHWQCLFANDIDPKKAATYAENWGTSALWIGDVARVSPRHLPHRADLAWASFPCQDLSLAGPGAGIHARRSGAFWPFWQLMQSLRQDHRAPKLIVLENVCGALSSNSGQDFAALGTALLDSNYRFGAVVMDAVNFVPQSRPRLFIIAVDQSLAIPPSLCFPNPSLTPWHPKAIHKAYGKLPPALAEQWIWWHIPAAPPRRQNFIDLLEESPEGVRWHDPSQTQKLLNMMSRVNLKKVSIAQQSGQKMVGGVYRRTRNGEQRAEVRFDNISGCLRTPAGGSSRQTLLIVHGESVRSRLLSPREACRLMGLPDSYKIPHHYNTAYHLAGDGLVVPVVRHLCASLLEPILANHDQTLAQEEPLSGGCAAAAVG